jgi:hypothetical protein
MVLSISVVPDELAAGLDEPPAAGAVPGVVVAVELDELAQAATASTTAAKLEAVNTFRIGTILLTPCMSPIGDHVAADRSVHLRFLYFRDQVTWPPMRLPTV